jgi:hypothetical protein
MVARQREVDAGVGVAVGGFGWWALGPEWYLAVVGGGRRGRCKQKRFATTYSSYPRHVGGHRVTILIFEGAYAKHPTTSRRRLPAVGNLKRYSKTLEYEYRVKTVALSTLKRYSILSLTLYLEW